MSNAMRSEPPIENPKTRPVDTKLEVVVIPVSDVNRAKRFYDGLGWRLDADFTNDADFRVIQFTPPGSGCAIIFGRNVTAAAPGSAQGLYLIVSDIDAARRDLIARGVEVSDVFHDASGVYAGKDEPYLFGRLRIAGRDPEHRSYRSFASFKDPDATAGCSRKSPRDCRDASTPTRRPSQRRATWRRPCAAPPPPTANTRNATAASTTRTGRTGTPNIWSTNRPAGNCRYRQFQQTLAHSPTPLSRERHPPTSPILRRGGQRPEPQRTPLQRWCLHSFRRCPLVLRGDPMDRVPG